MTVPTYTHILGGQMPGIPQTYLSAVRAQLAVDLNCRSGDFGGDGLFFAEAADNPGRRPFPRGDHWLEMATMGGAAVVSASPSVLPRARRLLAGKTRDDAFAMPFVRGFGLFFLPAQNAAPPLPDGYQRETVERGRIPGLYAFPGFRNALQYDVNHPRPDVLALVARHDGGIAGMAAASADCEKLWQIGIDVLPGHRGRGLGAALVRRLSDEILRRGHVPYYGAAATNIASLRTALRAGFAPAWTAAFRCEMEPWRFLSADGGE